MVKNLPGTARDSSLSLVWEYPSCRGASKLCAASWGCELLLLSPHLATAEACAWPCAPQLESGPHLPWLTTAHISSKDSPQPKNKINNVHDLNKPYDLNMCIRKKIHDNAIKYLHHKSEFIVIWVVIQWKQKWEVLFYKCSFPVTYDAYFFWVSLFISLSFISLMEVDWGTLISTNQHCPKYFPELPTF